jgi:hypothetical protein
VPRVVLVVGLSVAVPRLTESGVALLGVSCQGLCSKCHRDEGYKCQAGNTKGGSITVPLTSCLTGLESAV